MALTQITGPYPIFTDLDGSPLDDGYLYIGEINEDPETNPIQVYWDSNLTIPATQPIRTNSGYAYRNGTPALIYTGSQFSITIRNKKREFVLYSPVGYGFDPGAVSASVVKNDFTGDGVEVDFTLSASPSTKLATNVFINGVYQEKDSYSLSGNVITFSVAPPLGSSIEVMTNETGVINTGNATAITYTASFPGAVQQTVQTKLEQYVSVKDFGAVGDGVTDDTAAIQAALSAANQVYFPTPAVDYLVSSIDIPADRTLVTDGASVKFQQKSGQPVGTRVFNVMGPNVVIGDMTVEGNISTDTDEQNHAININSGVAGTDLYNVRVGNIRGINIRGDVVYIGQTLASGTTSGISVASADGNNILRNVVSVVGGSDIEIGQVTGPAVGYMHVDIEPDGTYTGNAVNVRVGQVTGRHIGVVVNNPSGDLVFNENIQFGEVNLDPAFATQSTPAYAPGASIASRAVILRSTKDVAVGTLKVNGYDGSAIWKESGGVTDISVVIGQAFLSDCNKVDGNTYGYVMCNNVTFGYLNVDTPLTTAVNQHVLGADNCVVNSGQFSLGSTASLARNGSGAAIRNANITFKATATSTYVVLSATNAQLKNCTVTGAERLAGFSTGLDVENSSITTSVAVLNTVTKAVYKNSTINSQYYAFATGDRAYTEAIAFGTQFLWVDSAGKLRIKSGAPTSDTDGTVVGTQT